MATSAPADAAQPKPAAVEAASVPEAGPAWQQFTPPVDSCKCLARTWGGGRGGQCGRTPKEGQVFCESHLKNDQWATHGRVDGAIPDAKLQEFIRAASKQGSPRTTAASQGESPPSSARRPRTRSAAKVELGAEVTPEAPPAKRRRQVVDRAAVPEGVKKPVGGGYSIFLAEKLAEIKSSLPAGHRVTDVTKRAGELWRALGEPERQPYVEEFAKKAAAYKAAVESKQAANLEGKDPAIPALAAAMGA